MTKPILRPISLGDCDFSVIDLPLDTPSDVLGYYDRFRAYLEHEDELINSRLRWSLTIHGFLFAIYGLLVGKAADMFINFRSSQSPSLTIGYAISVLFLIQLPVAAFGALVGYQSREAIVASHNAIRHLNAIAQKSGVLGIIPKQFTVMDEIERGMQTITAVPEMKLRVGARLLVYSDSDADEEIVEVAEMFDGSFSAWFTMRHSAGAYIRPLGTMLLPKITRGGDRGSHTGGARVYYLDLPRYAMWNWVVLGVASLAVSLAILINPAILLFGR